MTPNPGGWLGGSTEISPTTWLKGIHLAFEGDAVSAYPPELVKLTYQDWLYITRLPTSLTAPAVMLWGHDSNLAYGMWRAQNSESIYATQRIIAGWFAVPETKPRDAKRGRRNRKHDR
jgi:hypothetical protein